MALLCQAYFLILKCQLAKPIQENLNVDFCCLYSLNGIWGAGGGGKYLLMSLSPHSVSLTFPEMIRKLSFKDFNIMQIL